ncbi:unnamed protein product, partial [Rotaria sp. Silwood1]
PIRDIRPGNSDSRSPTTYVAACACYGDHEGDNYDNCGDVGGGCDDGGCSGCGGGCDD